MFDNFYKSNIEYEEFNGIGSNNQPTFKTKVNIKGIRVKGQIKVVHTDDGDETTCTICYRTRQRIIPQSKLNGREVMMCIPVNALWVSEEQVGYTSYVK
ncbi:MAG: hypothetical protein II625_02920 [Bacilli bacterium]|nr:hypothetical protein [Bacilli bacterium]